MKRRTCLSRARCRWPRSNDAPYGNERPYNAPRLARALASEEKKHSLLAELTDWTAQADKVLVF